MKIPRWLTVAFIVLLAAVAGSASVAARAAGRVIYPDPGEARADIAHALQTAARTHKRVLLDFGGNWCGDCQVLDIYLHNPQNAQLLAGNFVLVHINVGQFDANLDLAKKYQIPLDKGVPAMAVLSSTGKLLYSQKGGEFESMRRLDANAVTRFLVQWKAGKAGCSVVAVNC